VEVAVDYKRYHLLVFPEIGLLLLFLLKEILVALRLLMETAEAPTHRIFLQLLLL
jgi:hypothetical protein